jgi:hypothetical protein
LLAAHFAELTTFRSEQDQHKFRIMEDVQGVYNHEEEIRGMYVHMGNEGTNSNGHGEGKEESMNLVETIKSLQKDVLSYKVIMRGL